MWLLPPTTETVSSQEAVRRDMARRQECLDVVGGSCAATYSNANFCTPRPGCPQQGDPQSQVHAELFASTPTGFRV